MESTDVLTLPGPGVTAQLFDTLITYKIPFRGPFHLPQTLQLNVVITSCVSALFYRCAKRSCRHTKYLAQGYMAPSLAMLALAIILPPKTYAEVPNL